MPTSYEIPFRKVYDGSGRSTKVLAAKLETSEMALSNQRQALINCRMNNKYGKNNKPKYSKMAKILNKGNYGS